MTRPRTRQRRAAPARAGRALLAAACIALAVPAPAPAGAQDGGRPQKGPSIISPRGPSLIMPTLDPARGRKLFAAKACVVCHSVNGVGGTVGPRLDASEVMPYASPFEFAARMWRGADAMIALQAADLGYQIDIDGEELGDLTAFAYDRSEQLKFSEDDIPRHILLLMKTRNL